MMTTDLTKNNAVIITAAGSSLRFGEKKEYLPLDGNADSGITVLSQSLYAFVETGLFVRYIVTVPAGAAGLAETLFNADKRLELFLNTNRAALIITAGGATRQQSVYAGLKQLDTEHIKTVLVHDGARPWVSAALIDTVLEATTRYGAAVPAISVTDTQKEIDGSGKIIRHLLRDRIVAVQTPQGFCCEQLIHAHRCAEHDGRTYTDDSEIYAAYCNPVFICEGLRENKKITYREDLKDIL
ncbi:MAG: IspD/TarI family cytidylyltransferase [Treponema sp.]